MPEFEGLTEAVSTIVPIKNRRVWRDLARILSTVFNPFLTAFALFVILAHIGAKDTVEGDRRLGHGQRRDKEQRPTLHS